MASAEGCLGVAVNLRGFWANISAFLSTTLHHTFKFYLFTFQIDDDVMDSSAEEITDLLDITKALEDGADVHGKQILEKVLFLCSKKTAWILYSQTL